MTPTRATLLGLLLLATSARAADPPLQPPPGGIFGRDNLVAWCIVPFDSKKRGPEDRAAMLQRLGFKHFAYDWRGEHIPTFDAEVEALKRHGVALDAFWTPGELNADSRRILDLLGRHGIKAQLWVLLGVGEGPASPAEQARRVEAAAGKLKPLADEAAKIGCTLALYNHGGWFGEPENQVAIIARLKKLGATNVGMVYNLHHGHEHSARFAELLNLIMPHLRRPEPRRDGPGRRPRGRGRSSRSARGRSTSACSGRSRTRATRDRSASSATPTTTPRTGSATTSTASTGSSPSSTARPPARGRSRARPSRRRPAVVGLLSEARAHGDARRGAEVFASARFACLSCHKVAGQGGEIGPELTAAGACVPAEELVESLLWPKARVKEGYEAVAVETRDGRVRQGYRQSETAAEIVLRDPASGEVAKLDPRPGRGGPRGRQPDARGDSPRR